MPDRVLVTGISGFVGGHLALALLAAGYEVRGSVRSLDRVAGVRDTLLSHGADPARLEFVALDLLEDAGWDAAMEGVRYLQHVASPLPARRPLDRDKVIRPAIEGTRRAVAAALGNRVERVVLTSSIAAIQYGHDPSRVAPFTAADWTRLGPRRLNAYIESKTRAELEAWRLMGAAGRSTDLAVANPGIILGPLLDADAGTSTAMLGRLLDGDFPALPRLSFSFVDVRDVTELLVAAMSAPAAGGHRYPIAGPSTSARELAVMLRKAVPGHAARVPTRQAPDWLVRLAALASREIRDSVTELGLVRQIDATDAEALIGHPLRPAKDAVADAARSLVAYRDTLRTR